LMAHAVVGAVVAQASGHSALAGAAGATAGEFIAQQLYPGTDRNQLTEEQKQTVSTLGTLAASLAGGLTGGSAADTVAGAQAGKNAVENNALSVAPNKSRAEEMSQCQGNKTCEGTVTEKYRKLSAEQQKSVVECTGARACVDKANEVSRLQADYASRTSELLEKARTTGGLSPAEQNELSVLQVTTVQLEADRNAAIHNALASGDSEEAKQLAINSLAQAAGTSAAGIAAGVGKAGNHSSGIKDNRLPIPETTVANNGFKIESNPKHTPGAPGSRPSAGVEPKNSLSLFENSIATKDPKIRLSIDNDGNIHRFFNTSKDGSGTYHWSGSTGDGKNALGNRELGSFNKEIKELKGKK
ncbi:VENN motif pre-toxin domain-containing protein, partial [Erwinia amylovora]|uniref:VENN motif pre-toxin domain-containing protein n=1 Tax=Erwinia amylovora TaxID=552 RepID=UPI0015D517A6